LRLQYESKRNKHNFSSQPQPEIPDVEANAENIASPGTVQKKFLLITGKMKKSAKQLHSVLFPQWVTINWLLIMAPVGISLRFAHFNPIAIFIVNFAAIIPLSNILGFATEQIALRVGDTLGGLINASFGYVCVHSTALNDAD
jgi:hypothetical protein